jgi:hypothetical protein
MDLCYLFCNYTLSLKGEEVKVTKEDLETKAGPLIEKLSSGTALNFLTEEQLRWALAYKMWADGMDLEGEIPCIMDSKDQFWTRDCVEGYLTRVFGFNKIVIQPGFGG